MKVTIFTDGGARGNPGPAGFGAAVYDHNGKLVLEIKGYLGNLTNNQAEYEAVIVALQKAKELGADKVTLKLDSELIVRQLTGRYKIKSGSIADRAAKALALTRQFVQLNFVHVPRSQNALADQLVNQAIDEGLQRQKPSI
ncbi:MAG: ribonuclease HI family protein [Candidatus Doudnabacteria bacterium]|nr:ribonuclease HI family protein [Candidatus Doudnabacteria bacterium]